MKEKGGFSYHLNPEQIRKYRAWPLERRLKWIFLANKMRKSLNSKTIKIQETFRAGRI